MVVTAYFSFTIIQVSAFLKIFHLNSTLLNYYLKKKSEGILSLNGGHSTEYQFK